MSPILVRDLPEVSCPGKRIFDVLTSVTFLALTTPLFLVVALIAFVGGGSIMKRQRLIGRWGLPFDRISFGLQRSRFGAWLRSSRFATLPVLLNILYGEMSFVGPRPTAYKEGEPSLRSWHERWSVRPGVVSLWTLRQQANMDFDDEWTVDAEYVQAASLVEDWGILLRAIPNMIFGKVAECENKDRVEMLGLTIDNLTMEGAVDAIVKEAQDSQPRRVVFVNAHCVNVAYKKAAYRDVLHRSDLVLADGIGMRIAGKVLGGAVRQNVNGTDLFPRLLERLEKEGLSVFLLGARDGVAQAVADWAKERFPQLIIAGTHHGYLNEMNPTTVEDLIRASKADVLFVAMGVPHQERWLADHLENTGASVGLAVGGLFDFFSGRTARAPMWMRELGLEWMFRLIQEPRRMWRRYIVGNVAFLAHVFASKYFGGRVL